MLNGPYFSIQHSTFIIRHKVRPLQTSVTIADVIAKLGPKICNLPVQAISITNFILDGLKSYDLGSGLLPMTFGAWTAGHYRRLNNWRNFTKLAEA
jgi:hypothetical protein